MNDEKQGCSVQLYRHCRANGHIQRDLVMNDDDQKWNDCNLFHRCTHNGSWEV